MFAELADMLPRDIARVACMYAADDTELLIWYIARFRIPSFFPYIMLPYDYVMIAEMDVIGSGEKVTIHSPDMWFAGEIRIGDWLHDVEIDDSWSREILRVQQYNAKIKARMYEILSETVKQILTL
jgi:hypothetical protein